MLTSRRFVFTPNRFDQMTGGQAWSTPRAEVASVGIETRSPSGVFSGGLPCGYGWSSGTVEPSSS